MIKVVGTRFIASIGNSLPMHLTTEYYVEHASRNELRGGRDKSGPYDDDKGCRDHVYGVRGRFIAYVSHEKNVNGICLA